MPNITTNHAITYTYYTLKLQTSPLSLSSDLLAPAPRKRSHGFVTVPSPRTRPTEKSSDIRSGFTDQSEPVF